MTVEFQVPMGSRSFPEDGCFKPGNDLVRLKVEVEGEFVLSMDEQDANPATVRGGGALGVSVAHEFQTKLARCEASGEFELSMEDAEKIFSSNDRHEMRDKLFECVSAGLSAEFDLGPGTQVTVGTEAGFDSDLCFFAATIELTFECQIGRGSDPRATASVTGSVEIRFGPGLRVYQDIARRMGVPVIERFLTRAIPRVVSESALIGILDAINIWALAAELGYHIMQLSQWICRNAWERGVRRGQTQAYASAYIRAVYMGSNYHLATINAIERAAIEQAEEDAFFLGLAMLRQQLERRYNQGRHFHYGAGQRFLTTDGNLHYLIDSFGAALDVGAPVSQRYR